MTARTEYFEKKINFTDTGWALIFKIGKNWSEFTNEKKSN